MTELLRLMGWSLQYFRQIYLKEMKWRELHTPRFTPKPLYRKDVSMFQHKPIKNKEYSKNIDKELFTQFFDQNFYTIKWKQFLWNQSLEGSFNHYTKFADAIIKLDRGYCVKNKKKHFLSKKWKT